MLVFTTETVGAESILSRDGETLLSMFDVLGICLPITCYQYVPCRIFTDKACD